MLTTFGINKIVDIKFKKEKAKTAGNEQVIRGRVYTPKEEPKKEQPKKEKKKKEVPENDFLTGKADGNKRVRGRLK